MSKYSLLTKDILQQDYDELGTLSAIACKYNMPVSSVKSLTRRLKVELDKPGGKCKYTVDENIFDNDSETSFYIAGFAAADGNVAHNKHSNTSVFRIGLSRKDRDHLEKIKSALQFTGPICDHEFLSKNKTAYCSSMNIYCSKKLVSDLSTNFNVVPQKTFIYEFPEKLVNHKMVNHFIRGYFDGDGCFSTDKRDGSLSFELLGTQKFLESVKCIFERECELLSRRDIFQFKNVYRLRYSAKKSITNIVRFLYKDADFYLTRKYDIIKHLL